MSIRPAERSAPSTRTFPSAPPKPAVREPVVPLHLHGEASSFEPKQKKPGLFDSLKDLVGKAKAQGGAAVDDELAKTKVPAKGVGFDTYPGVPIKSVPVVGNVGTPSANNYGNVIDQFKVETNPRYKPTDSKTFCNVFATDVMLAMGASTPTPPYSLNANQYSDWLAKQGPAKGWKAVSPAEAQKMANAGKPVLASWKNPDADKSGHIAVVRPGTYDSGKGPATANAGKTNFNDGHATDGFKSGPASDIKYYVYEPSSKPTK